MIYVKLPNIGINGGWGISDEERTLAARLVPMLPASPAAGADAATRWQTVQTTLHTISETIRENGQSLFGGRPHIEQPGKVDMIGMPFAIATLFSDIGTEHRLYSSQGRGNECLITWTERLEPEVAELRRLFAAAAAS